MKRHLALSVLIISCFLLTPSTVFADTEGDSSPIIPPSAIQAESLSAVQEYLDNVRAGLSQETIDTILQDTLQTTLLDTLYEENTTSEEYLVGIMFDLVYASGESYYRTNIMLGDEAYGEGTSIQISTMALLRNTLADRAAKDDLIDFGLIQYYDSYDWADFTPAEPLPISLADTPLPLDLVTRGQGTLPAAFSDATNSSILFPGEQPLLQTMDMEALQYYFPDINFQQLTTSDINRIQTYFPDLELQDFTLPDAAAAGRNFSSLDLQGDHLDELDLSTNYYSEIDFSLDFSSSASTRSPEYDPLDFSHLEPDFGSAAFDLPFSEPGDQFQYQLPESWAGGDLAAGFSSTYTAPGSLDLPSNLPAFNYTLPEFDPSISSFDYTFPDFDYSVPDFDFNIPDFNYTLPDFDFSPPSFDYTPPSFDWPF